MRFSFPGLVAFTVLLAGCTGQAMLNSLTPTEGYDIAVNLVYDQAKKLRTDVYAPKNVSKAPVVVFLYGGRWTSGTKDDWKYVGEALASRGFVAAIPDYRQYPEVRFPEFVNDAARAIAWVRNNVKTYGGDPDKIFVMGHSSGAHIAALLTLKGEYLEGIGGSRNWIRGMIGLAGPYNFLPITDPQMRDIFGPPEKFEESQPILYTEGDNPPMLLMHGEDDEIVSVQDSLNLAQAIKKAGGPISTVIYPKMSHTFIVKSLAKPLRGQTDVIQHVTEFVRQWSKVPRTAAHPESNSIEAVPLAIE